MPVFEFWCTQSPCEAYQDRFERFLRRHSDDNPECPICGGSTDRLISNFSAPWTGTLDRFDDPKKQGSKSIEGGHTAYRVNSSRLADGSPEPVRITTRQEQIEFIRAEGLTDPADMNPNVHGTEDGVWESSRGLPGSWGGTPSTMSQDITQTKGKPVMSGAW